MERPLEEQTHCGRHAFHHGDKSTRRRHAFDAKPFVVNTAANDRTGRDTVIPPTSGQCRPARPRPAGARRPRSRGGTFSAAAATPRQKVFAHGVVHPSREPPRRPDGVPVMTGKDTLVAVRVAGAVRPRRPGRGRCPGSARSGSAPPTREVVDPGRGVRRAPPRASGHRSPRSRRLAGAAAPPAPSRAAASTDMLSHSRNRAPAATASSASAVVVTSTWTGDVREAARGPRRTPRSASRRRACGCP